MFGNSLFLGTAPIGTSTYHMLLILPEAYFNSTPVSSTNNVLSVYSEIKSLFYVSTLVLPSNTSNTNGTGNYEYSPETRALSYNRVLMSVSNAQLF